MFLTKVLNSSIIPSIMRSERKELKEKLIGMKLAATLVEAIDLEAESEGLSRSAVIRRILTRHYAKTGNERQVA
jgi:predicted DNA binding CopG/RHH family protein